MKKLSIVLGAALIMAGSAFAGDGKKDKAGCCSKDKKEACATEKHASAAKGKGCCTKGEGKSSASNVEVKKQTTKETKTTTAVKKS